MSRAENQNTIDDGRLVSVCRKKFIGGMITSSFELYSPGDLVVHKSSGLAATIVDMRRDHANVNDCISIKARYCGKKKA